MLVVLRVIFKQLFFFYVMCICGYPYCPNIFCFFTWHWKIKWTKKDSLCNKSSSKNEKIKVIFFREWNKSFQIICENPNVLLRSDFNALPYSLLYTNEIYLCVTIFSLKFIHILLTWTLHKCNTSEIRYYCCVRDINLVICFSFNFIIYLLYDLKTILWSTLLLPIFIIRERNFFLFLKFIIEMKKSFNNPLELHGKNIEQLWLGKKKFFIINFQSYLRQWFLLKWCAFLNFVIYYLPQMCYFF